MPHRDPLVGLPDVLTLARWLTGDLYPRSHTFAAAEGHWATYHLPLAGLIGVAIADLELHREDRAAGG